MDASKILVIVYQTACYHNKTLHHFNAVNYKPSEFTYWCGCDHTPGLWYQSLCTITINKSQVHCGEGGGGNKWSLYFTTICFLCYACPHLFFFFFLFQFISAAGTAKPSNLDQNVTSPYSTRYPTRVHVVITP